MRIDGKLTEECAVFGISTTGNDAAGITYNGLLSLQHRGQEGAGIAVALDTKIQCHKQVGLVSEVFSQEILGAFPRAKLALGHARYSTTGANCMENVGPFVTEYLTGRIATAHNGNVTNAQELRRELGQHGLDFSATSDSEVVSSLIAYSITREQDTLRGIIEAGKRLQGAFSLVVLSSENRLIAMRDPNGYRPLCLGTGPSGIAVASESCALDACGFTFLRDVLPGEVIVMENGELTHAEVALHDRQEGAGLCIFEYVYFARPDSVIDGLSVYEARYRMGAILAEEYPVDADVVCGVPDSGLEAAIGYSARSGIPLSPGFVKNRYIGRSFIYPTQDMRDSAVRLKLNPLAANVRDKRVVLVDDSIVRGTTCARLVKLLRDAGAAEVHMRISAPPFRHPCFFGTDIPERSQLLAHGRTVEEMREIIGVDSLGFLSLEAARKIAVGCKLGFCDACFSGEYPIPVPEQAEKNMFENEIPLPSDQG